MEMTLLSFATFAAFYMGFSLALAAKTSAKTKSG